MEYYALRHLLGFAEYRPRQEECVRALLKGEDLLVVMQTGGGKSAIYQIPAMVFYEQKRPERCLVISPLVSLISDQVDALNRKLCLTPTGTIARVDEAVGGKVAGRLGEASTPFVFITPERLRLTPEVVAALRLSLIVVDEAHCISAHGLAFREDYRALSQLRQLHPSVPICALTATASSAVLRDIAASLGLRRGHVIVRAPIDRSNLRLSVVFRKTFREDVGDVAHRLGRGQGIVYFQTRDEVEKGAEALKDHGVDAAPYHAGLPPSLRRSVQDRFVRGELRCIAATIAFGMGIDVPGVRCVVHYGLPGTLENYLQEIGRAGRDGAPANCVLFWSSADASARGRCGEKNIDPALAARGLRAMLDFAQSAACLRSRLATHFEDADGASTCASRGGELCCRCRDDGHRSFVEYGVESRSLLETVDMIRTGATKQLDYHVGKSGKCTAELRKKHDDRLFGAGANSPLVFWKALHEELRGSGYIHSNEHGVCFLTACGKQALNGDDPLVLREIILEAARGPTKRPLELSGKSLEEPDRTSGACGSHEFHTARPALDAISESEVKRRRSANEPGSSTQQLETRLKTAGSKWTAEADGRLWCSLGGVPLTPSGFLPSDKPTCQIISELALRYGRTTGAIRSRVQHMRDPAHKACRILESELQQMD
jgi:ATP-dependent DNA helicase RecQ